MFLIISGREAAAHLHVYLGVEAASKERRCAVRRT